ncbi:hypothetical protein AAMO2058_000744100 [Amorphochlora amoebiformis]
MGFIYRLARDNLPTYLTIVSNPKSLLQPYSQGEATAADLDFNVWADIMERIMHLEKLTPSACSAKIVEVFESCEELNHLRPYLNLLNSLFHCEFPSTPEVQREKES